MKELNASTGYTELSNFFQQVRDELKETLASLRNHVVINPNLQKRNFLLDDRRLTLQEKEAYLIWCLLKENQEDLCCWTYRLQVQAYTKRFSDNLGMLPLLVTVRNYSELLIVLGETNYYHAREFFGNFKRSLKSALLKLRIVDLDKGKVKKPLRKRGYNDKGSRDENSAWKRARAYWLDTEQQNINYEAEQALKDSMAFIRGMID